MKKERISPQTTNDLLIGWEEKRECLRGFLIIKVENILKGSLDSIPSRTPSVKIQLMGGKVCLRYECKTLLGVVHKLMKTKKC